MRITVLTENTSQLGLPTEHGLSLYIETKEYRALFDCGQSELFAENAARLGVDLSDVDICVISHGHYDHGGGLKRFMELNSTADIYISRYAFEPHYNGEKYIGLDVALADSPRLKFTSGKTVIADGLTLYDCNDMDKIDRFSSFGLSRRDGDTVTDDDFRHEQYLLIEEDGKRVLISGCSHKGIINLAEWFRPDALIGGFHFMKLPPGDILRGYAEKLDAYDTAYYTCHCTGEEQYEYIRPIMRRLDYISAGQILEI